MKFMILIYGSEQAWNALGETDFKELAKAHADVKMELMAHNELIATSELDMDATKTIKSADGLLHVSDGPFTEGREVVSGYYLVECTDVQRAVNIASRFAEAKFAPIEVCQLGEGSTWVKNLQ